MKTAAVLRLPPCRDLSRQTRVSTSNYSALTTGLVRPRNAINYLQKRFPSPKWENSTSGTLSAKWLQKKWEWSSTTMNTKSSDRFSSCTNKRGNCCFNHARAAFGLLDPYNAESFGDYAVWRTQQRGEALHSAVAHLKGKCGKMLTSLSLLSRQHRRRHRRTRAAVARSLSLSQSLFGSHLHYGWFI